MTITETTNISVHWEGITKDISPFPLLLVGRALLLIKAIATEKTAREVERSFGVALGYQNALAELGLISGDLRLELTQEAEHVYNDHICFQQIESVDSIK